VFNKIKTISLALIVTLLAASVFSISPVFPAKNAYAGFLDYVNLNCAAPKIYPRLCVRVHRGRVQFGAKVRFWLPIGLMEVTPKACDFGGFGLLSALNPLKEICNSIPVAQGRGTQNWMFKQNYMRNHVHIYTIPRPILEMIATAIKAKFKLPCISIGIDDILSISSVGISDHLSALKDVKERLDKINSLLQGFSPIFISELVSPIWLTDSLSPDARTIAPVINAAIASLMSASPAAGVLACPYLAQAIGGGIKTPVIDPSFICVGHWGKGYPRIGVVRHDHPIIANALAGVRFWHLFSNTIPVISEKFSFNHKLQIAYPAVSPCFHPGDPILPQLALTYAPTGDRKSAFIIWKEFGCCAY
jgi:hypothetical protein